MDNQDNNRQAFYGLVDSVIAHPSTKPHIPMIQDIATKAEFERFKVEVRSLIYRIEAILNAFEYRHELGWVETDDSAESPF